MRHLIVANQTLQSQQLEETVRLRTAEGATHFHIVVPATQPADQAEPVEGDAVEVANDRLKSAIERFGALGASVSGEVGTEEPLDAIRDAVEKTACDSIIVVTLPQTRSRWLRRDLPAKLRRQFPTLLIDHVQLAA